MLLQYYFVVKPSPNPNLNTSNVNAIAVLYMMNDYSSIVEKEKKMMTHMMKCSTTILTNNNLK